jgi:hypothetical protein
MKFHQNTKNSLSVINGNAAIEAAVGKKIFSPTLNWDCPEGMVATEKAAGKRIFQWPIAALVPLLAMANMEANL